MATTVIAARAAALCLLGLLTVAGCDRGAGTPDTSPSPASPAAAPVDRCPADARIDGLTDRQGAGDGATLWARFFPTTPELHAGTEIKIVWRMTGSGPLTMSATGPGGRSTTPIWGPEPHGSSNFDRPGEEWGTGWTFPTPGCWTVEARRTTGSARLTVRAAGPE